jgi:hypothetical protein
MKLNLQSYGHYAVLKVTETVSPDHFPVLKAGILKIAQHDRIVGKVAVVLDVTAVDEAIAASKDLATGAMGLTSWAGETGVMLTVVSANPAVGQASDVAAAQAKFDSPAGKQSVADFVTERETKGLAKQVEAGQKRIEEHQNLRRRAALQRGRVQALVVSCRDVWKDRKPAYELASHTKRMTFLTELINQVPRK